MLQACAKKSIEKRFNEVLLKQGIDSEEIEKIWKVLPRTHDNRKDIGLVREHQDIFHDLPDNIVTEDCSESDEEPSEEVGEHGYEEDYSEHDLADSISLNLSPTKEQYS